MAGTRRKRRQSSKIPRKQRVSRSPFGRAASGDLSGDLTDFGCPDCRGVLAVRDEGHRGHLVFTCSIGHVYSGETLIESKEEQLENTLWSVVEVYQEIALLHGDMAGRALADGSPTVAAAYRRRAKRAGTLVADLRRIIGRDGPAMADRAKV